MDFIISTESSSDIPQKKADELGIYTVKMSYEVNGVIYGGKTGKEIEESELCSFMKSGIRPHTSMINEETAEEFFKELLTLGKDILHISFASACSGTHDCIKRVADELNKTHENKIYVVDSKAESLGVGLLTELTVDYAREGHDVKETALFAETMRDRINMIFTVDDLKYLYAGGRVSKVTAIVGTILHVKPLLYVDETGKLLPSGKVMSRRLALKSVVERAVMKYDGSSKKMYVGYCDCKEDAEKVAETLSSLTGAEAKAVNIGPVICAHSGPGTLSLFFVGKDRTPVWEK